MLREIEQSELRKAQKQGWAYCTRDPPVSQGPGPSRAVRRTSEIPQEPISQVVDPPVDVLKVEHVIVCGHYGCGGVRAAYTKSSLGLIDNWLRHVQDVHVRHADVIDRGASEEDRINLLCEWNVVAQARHVCQTSIVQEAWRRKQPLHVHGWIYDLRDGLLRDLGCTANGPAGSRPL